MKKSEAEILKKRVDEVIRDPSIKFSQVSDKVTIQKEDNDLIITLKDIVDEIEEE